MKNHCQALEAVRVVLERYQRVDDEMARFTAGFSATPETIARNSPARSALARLADLERALGDSHVEELVEALRWYASKEAYETEGRVGDTVFDRLRREVRVFTDRGQRARAALAKLEGKP